MKKIDRDKKENKHRDDLSKIVSAGEFKKKYKSRKRKSISIFHNVQSTERIGN